MKDRDEIKIKIRYILSDYYRRGNYTLEQAESDIMNALLEFNKSEVTDEDIHFAGKRIYNCDLVSDGKTKQKIIQLANAYRRGAKEMRDRLIKHNTK